MSSALYVVPQVRLDAEAKDILEALEDRWTTKRRTREAAGSRGGDSTADVERVSQSAQGTAGGLGAKWAAALCVM